MAKQLFIVGPSRSGTTAMMRYLNDHPRILVLKERYKHIPRQVTPELFTKERVLERSPEETNMLPEEDERNLKSKDLDSLKWFGDKVPLYVRHMSRLARRNPKSRFIVMWRPLEEVAASYKAISDNPQNRWLGGKDGLGIAIKHWHLAYERAREFNESKPRRMLYVEHSLLSKPEALAERLGPFLGVRFGGKVLKSWERRAKEWRHEPHPLSEEDMRRIREAE